MTVEFNEVLWLDHHHELSMQEVAQLSGLAETELIELVECGAILPLDPTATRYTFTARCVVMARTASRLRRDFELDTQGVSLAMALLSRVQELEQQLNELRALLPHRVA